MLTPEQHKEMYSDVKEMKNALLGNEYGQKGLVHRVETNEKYINKDRKLKFLVGGAIMGIGVWVGKGWDKIASIFIS